MTGFADILSSLQSEKRLRVIPGIMTEGMLDLSSNDYLSLGQRYSEFQDEFLDRFHDVPFSSSASRLLSVRQEYHLALESMLEGLYGKPSLLFNSGYHANVGCIGALNLPSTLFLCDKLIHASIVDGLRMSGCEFRRFSHNDISKLKKLLDKEYTLHEHIVVVVESIYSMDGDEAPLADIVALKKEFPNMLLYVDEAHAFGVRGERGLGVSEEYGMINDIDIIIGTFGKAAASAGAFAICSDELKSILINLARPFIFSTSLPPVNIAWTTLMVEKIVGMQKERAHLRKISEYFSDKISLITGAPTGSTSQIIPYLTGDASKALYIASVLRENGIIALPIRRPTVPPGGERIRFSLGSAMTVETLEPVIRILQNLRNEI